MYVCEEVEGRKDGGEEMEEGRDGLNIIYLL